MTISSRRLLAGATVLAGLTISIALASQYVGGLQPCDLCLQQRMPYYVGIPLMAAMLLAWKWLPRTARAILCVLVAGIFAWGAFLGGYHAGVEWGLWAGPTSCSGVGGEIDFGDIMNMKPVVRCDAVQFQFFGISLAGMNAVVSAMVSVLTMAAGLKARRV